MSSGESALDLAARRLEQAVHVLEQRLTQRLKTAGDAVGGLFDQDRATWPPNWTTRAPASASWRPPAPRRPPRSAAPSWKSARR